MWVKWQAKEEATRVLQEQIGAVGPEAITRKIDETTKHYTQVRGHSKKAWREGGCGLNLKIMGCRAMAGQLVHH